MALWAGLDVQIMAHDHEHQYTPYEGPSLADQNSRKLGVFNRKLEGSHSIYHFDKKKKIKKNKKKGK